MRHFRQITAHAAVPEVSLGTDYGLRKGFSLPVRKAENMKSEPLSGLAAYARKLA